MTPYIVNYFDEDDELDEILVYAVNEEAAMKVVDNAISAKELRRGGQMVRSGVTPCP